tara:strand:+ start:19 stop:462 length:444 start_codon:yes stop_codon:yes gene_type:complete
MVNQNPQPELYTTRHDFLQNNVTGTSVTQEIYTNQSFNEEVRIYGLMVNIVNEDGDSIPYSTLTTQGTWDYDISIQAGPNRIPSDVFSLRNIFLKNDRTVAFSVPVLILNRQPLQVTVQYNSADTFGANEDITVVVTLIAEMYIRDE